MDYSLEQTKPRFWSTNIHKICNFKRVWHLLSSGKLLFETQCKTFGPLWTTVHGRKVFCSGFDRVSKPFFSPVLKIPITIHGLVPNFKLRVRKVFCVTLVVFVFVIVDRAKHVQRIEWPRSFCKRMKLDARNKPWRLIAKMTAFEIDLESERSYGSINQQQEEEG